MSTGHASDPTSPTSQSILLTGQQVVLILVGLIGCGKSTFAQALEKYLPEFRRCSQDELGDRRSVEALARQSLRAGMSVCIDRTNFDESQRATWINIAHEFPNVQPWMIVFDIPFEICAARVEERTDHPTITDPALGLQVLRRFRSQYRPPTPHEGYTRILYLRPSDCPDSAYSEADIRKVVRRLRESPEVIPMAPPPSQRGGYTRRGFPSNRGAHGERAYHTRGRSSYRDSPSPRGGYRADDMRQTTLPWARPAGGDSGASLGSGSGHAFAARRSGYQDEAQPGYDRTQENWRK
ncbi:P-loop containing nucleoside triphosphate hydrolase protein [Trametes elegans]|nr:P-loop containing nucleoside triphosphate hydrolase protein [Trametes elegans]